jgi:hypothetical protein
MGGGGVENYQTQRDVICGRPLIIFLAEIKLMMKLCGCMQLELIQNQHIYNYIFTTPD